MRELAAAAAAALIVAHSSWAVAAEDNLIGKWTGLVLETGTNGAVDVWDVTLTVADLDHATIAYEGLDCGGTLAFLRTVGNVREYRETLTYGREKCIDGGTVGFSLNRGKLLWYWSGEGTSEPTALDVGVLSRQ
ncbi:MAG: hypothetical protein U1E56_04875 [Bauldia sp.]